MKLSLYTWNSLAINDGNPFIAVIPQGQLAQLRVNANLVPRADEYPALTAGVKQGSTLAINVIVAAGQDINTSRENLKKYFFADGNSHTLVAKDTADSDKQYYRTGIPVGLAEENARPNSFIVTIQTEFPYWQLVTAATDSWSITATGQTRSITNGGNLPVKPIYTLTPTTTKTAGYKYQRYIPIYNRLSAAYSGPMDITGGGLNTAALVADTAISNQINEAGNINNSVTTWNIDTSVGGGLPTTGGMFYMGTEQCTYTGISAGVISGVTRGVNGTTAASHLDNTVMYFSHLQADGDDLRVWMDGAETDRWLNSMNTSATKVWANVSLGPLIQSTLLAGINNSVQTLTFPQTAAGLAFLKSLKAATNTALLIESEVVVFAPANIDLINYQITSVTRGQKNTSAASHSAAKSVTYIDHDLFILYGDSTLSAPATNDANKPIFDLTSTNETWTWTSYFDSTAKRPGAWAGSVAASKTKLSYTYTATENAFADPATVLGLAERGAQDFTVPHENATLYWQLSHPAGITDITYSGEKYYTDSWPGVAGFQKLQAGAVWFTDDNQAAPALFYAWESFGPSTLDLGGTYPSIRFVIDGVLSSVINAAALIEFDTVSATFDSNYLPVIAVGSEAAINFFDFKLTNSTTGEWIKIKTPCPLNTALTVDTTTRTAYLADGRIVPVRLSTDRADWLNLSAGANTLQFDDAGTAGITFATSHKDRVL